MQDFLPEVLVGQNAWSVTKRVCNIKNAVSCCQAESWAINKKADRAASVLKLDA
jgi:hypothetical protein